MGLAELLEENKRNRIKFNVITVCFILIDFDD